MLDFEVIIRLSLYLTPMYMTNACAMLFGGKTRLDFNKTFFGKPLLGKGKTFEGTFSALSIGILTSYLIEVLFKEQTLLISNNYLLFGFLLAVGTLLGDIIASFFKRRIGLKPGEQLLFVDQLDFIAGGLTLTLWIYTPTIFDVSLMVIITLIAHKIANFIAYKIKIKKVPW